MKTQNFETKQEGYGRQGLYYIDDNKDKHYICSVFPNIPEHFNHVCLLDDCFYNEEEDIYTDEQGREVTPIDDWNDFLLEHYKEEIEELDI